MLKSSKIFANGPKIFIGIIFQAGDLMSRIKGPDGDLSGDYEAMSYRPGIREEASGPPESLHFLIVYVSFDDGVVVSLSNHMIQNVDIHHKYIYF